MGEQGHAARVIEPHEPSPQGLLVLRDIRLPGLLPFGYRFGGWAVLQVRGLDGEEDVANRGFEAFAVAAGALECDLQRECGPNCA
jgi:hypothetical protein